MNGTGQGRGPTATSARARGARTWTNFELIGEPLPARPAAQTAHYDRVRGGMFKLIEVQGRADQLVDERRQAAITLDDRWSSVGRDGGYALLLDWENRSIAFTVWPLINKVGPEGEPQPLKISNFGEGRSPKFDFVDQNERTQALFMAIEAMTVGGPMVYARPVTYVEMQFAGSLRRFTYEGFGYPSNWLASFPPGPRLLP
jgi:hypothetical protein